MYSVNAHHILIQRCCIVFCLIALLPNALLAAELSAEQKPRVIVLTDLSNEPDDEGSLVRFLVYANELDVEGLIATTSVHLKTGPREDIIRRDLLAYGKVLPNLSKHAAGFPAVERLQLVTGTGQTSYGMADVGDGKSSAGSRLIIEAVDKADTRPVWITIWGGANTLAQALWDVRQSRDATSLEKFVSKLRVYAISDQDDSNQWVRTQFPKLFYIGSAGNAGGSDYWLGTWTGISGDFKNKIGVMHHYEMVDNPWLLEHIRKNHGPLGELYPEMTHIMEGDTPSFLGLINNGLGWSVRPDYGGWGGRYKEYCPHGETRKFWTETRDSRDTVTSDQNGRSETSVYATIWRWREHFQSDFAARMSWCTANDFTRANHNPVAVLNGDKSKGVIELTAKVGETIHLSAEGTTDPDGQVVAARWWIYEEAGTLWDQQARCFPANVKLTADKGLSTSLVVPALPLNGKSSVAKPMTVHVILEVSDSGEPKLWSYRRAVVTISP